MWKDRDQSVKRVEAVQRDLKSIGVLFPALNLIDAEGAVEKELQDGTSPERVRLTTKMRDIMKAGTPVEKSPKEKQREEGLERSRIRKEGKRSIHKAGH